MSQVGGRKSSAASRRSFVALGHPGKFGQSLQSLTEQTGPGPQWSPAGHAISVAGILASIPGTCPAEIATGPPRAPEEDRLAYESDW